MKKKEGKIFTPSEIVRFMLDKIGYEPGTNVIDNSCGDGRILSEIVRMNIVRFRQSDLKNELESHIHGVEIDPIVCSECVENLNSILRENGIYETINWDIRCGDSLSIHDYDGKMDFVVGNPPYIRTKHLTGDTTGYTFMSLGMIDIYLAFFELGFKQMSEKGKMIYIAPSSWYSSIAGQEMRNAIFSNRHLSNIWDFGHNQVFENAQTYVSITLFDKSQTFKEISFEEVSYKDGIIESVDKFTERYHDGFINRKFYFGKPHDLNVLRDVLSQEGGSKHLIAKNGYATLCDELFIGNFEKESKYIIPVVKASNGTEKTAIYPYDNNGKLISEDEFKKTTPIAAKWLNEHREQLYARKTNEPWYAYGRTQGLPDTFKKKYGIKHIVKSAKDMTVKEIDSGIGVYGGLYVIVDEGYENFIENIYSEDFFNFVKLLRKYKSGGYYTFSTREFNAYASYYLKKRDSQ